MVVVLKVHDLCQGRPLCLLTPDTQTPSYATDFACRSPAVKYYYVITRVFGRFSAYIRVNAVSYFVNCTSVITRHFNGTCCCNSARLMCVYSVKFWYTRISSAAGAPMNAIPLQACTGPQGSKNFVDNRQMKVVRLSAPRTGRLYPPRSQCL